VSLIHCVILPKTSLSAAVYTCVSLIQAMENVVASGFGSESGSGFDSGAGFAVDAGICVNAGEFFCSGAAFALCARRGSCGIARAGG
jgi:hypothetical protein